MKHAAIIPLIGFQNLAVESVIGARPEYILSYPAFYENEKHLINHYNDVPYHTICADSNTLPNVNMLPKVDIVHSVCPCAALSPLNNGSAKGADAPQNDWMYLSTEFVLRDIKPTALFGENAARLGTPSGRKVADKLYEIGKQYGYTFIIYCTEAKRHGSPQKRPRTFYAFFKGNTVPKMNRYDTKSMQIADILNAPVPANDPMNILMNKNKPTDDGWMAYAIHKANVGGYSDFVKTLDTSTNIIEYASDEDGNYLEAAEWFKNNGYDKFYKRCLAIQEKINAKKSFWGHGTYVPAGNECNAFVGAKPLSMTHPTENRYLTVREGLRMMGCPDDFNMSGDPIKQLNMMCQNVTFAAAKDFAVEVIETIKGNREMISSNYVVQSNINGKIDDRQSRSLSDVFTGI